MKQLYIRAAEAGLEEGVIHTLREPKAKNDHGKDEGKSQKEARVRQEIQAQLRGVAASQLDAQQKRLAEELLADLVGFDAYKFGRPGTTKEGHTATLFQLETGTCYSLIVHHSQGHNSGQAIHSGHSVPFAWKYPRVAEWAFATPTAQGQPSDIADKAKRAFEEDEITGGGLKFISKKQLRRTLDAQGVGNVVDMIEENRDQLFTTGAAATSPVVAPPTVHIAPQAQVLLALPPVPDRPPEPQAPPAYPGEARGVTRIRDGVDASKPDIRDERFGAVSEFHGELRNKLLHLHDDICGTRHELHHLRTD